MVVVERKLFYVVLENSSAWSINILKWMDVSTASQLLDNIVYFHISSILKYSQLEKGQGSNRDEWFKYRQNRPHLFWSLGYTSKKSTRIRKCSDTKAYDARCRATQVVLDRRSDVVWEQWRCYSLILQHHIKFQKHMGRLPWWNQCLQTSDLAMFIARSTYKLGTLSSWGSVSRVWTRQRRQNARISSNRAISNEMGSAGCIQPQEVQGFTLLCRLPKAWWGTVMNSYHITKMDKCIASLGDPQVF